VVRIRLFGGVSAATDGGEPLGVGSAKSQAVLAALAVSPGSAVPVSRLVDLVWGEAAPATAEKTLQWHIARLRKGLGLDAIVRMGAAYRLDVERDAVDVARFQRYLAIGDVDAALVEWTGTPLAGLDAPGLGAIVDGLVEQWLGAVEADLSRRVDTDPQAAIGPLTEFSASYPFREGLWALLMTALYRVGRQGDALAAYRTARQHLVEQLGVEPGRRLRQLESQILDHDERLGTRQESTDPGPRRPTGTVTFGFVELDDSTRRWVTHSQKATAAMARLDRLVRSTVDGYGGYLFATGGESFGVAFHRADEAAGWAAELQIAVGSEPWPGGVDVRVRIGLHTGETEEHTTGYFGPAVHVAARIAAAGHGGQILASTVTGSLLDRADLRDLGSIRLDDYTIAEQRIFQVNEGEYPPIRMAAGRPGNLPTRMGRLIGREQELTVIGEALSQYPIVTLVGPGGIGKTRLALMAARIAARTRGWGAWLIELAGLTSSNDVPRAVADTLGVTEQPGRSLTQSIVTVLHSRPALLIIDNCEHVIDGAARLAQAIAEDCPNVRMLATSRERLHIAHEQLVVVGPLDPAGAGVELFHARALAVDLAFDLDAHRDDVEEICRRLDGIPLAIELAAARTRSLAPPELVSRLDDRLRLMTGGGRISAERHRTLGATFQWSYDLLTPPEQTMLARLSIFAGPFDLAAAENVVADAVLDVVAVDALLGDLVERSMLIAEVSPFGQRFRLLETVRQFAAEHLRERGHADRLVERHASWCLDRVTDIHRLLIGAGEIEGVARLAALWPNLRSAVDRACSTRDAALADALIRPVATEIALRGRHEIADWAERILALTPTPAEDVLVFWLIWIAERYQQNGDHAGYECLVRRHGEPDRPLVRYSRAYLFGEGEALRQCLPGAVAQLSTQGDDYMAAFIQAMAAGSLLGIGRFQEVDATISALADRYRAHGPPTLLHWTLQTLGYSASFQGRHAAADQFFDEAADVEIPDRTLSANKLLEARSAFQHGQRARAFQILRLYIDDLIETGNLIAASVVSIEFVNMMAAIDRLAEAAHMLGYLETINDFGALASKTLVADAARKVTDNAANIAKPPQPGGHHLDDRRALAYMRDVLADLGQRGIRSGHL
jgi:predicted ATPase/DNA-binding SARP family transcriptional activator